MVDEDTIFGIDDVTSVATNEELVWVVRVVIMVDEVTIFGIDDIVVVGANDEVVWIFDVLRIVVSLSTTNVLDDFSETLCMVVEEGEIVLIISLFKLLVVIIGCFTSDVELISWVVTGARILRVPLA